MVAATEFYTWIAYVNDGAVSLSGDQFTVFLTNTAPAQTDELIGDVTEVSYTNLSSRDLTTGAVGQTTGTYTMDVDALVMTASGTVGPFRYIGVYDSTHVDGPLMCFYDYGSSITMASGDTFTFTPTGAIWTDAP